MYAAKKYFVTNLTKKCFEFLQQSLPADTAPQLLEQSILLGDEDLKAKVLIKIEEEAPAVLSSDEFMTLSKEALHEILQLNLKISNEMEVFNASLHWAESRCKQLKRTVDGANMREVLGDNLFLIQFPVMTIDDINDTIIPQDILTEREQLHIFRYLTARSKPENLPFLIEPRQDWTPRTLVIPAPYGEHSGTVDLISSCTEHTSLNCSFSRPVQIRAILIFNVPYESKIDPLPRVTLTQNEKPLLNSGDYGTIAASKEIPRHLAVKAKDFYVKAGPLQVDIQLKLTNRSGKYYNCYNIPCSSQATKLSDNFVSIEFPPVARNLLLGSQYSPM